MEKVITNNIVDQVQVQAPVPPPPALTNPLLAKIKLPGQSFRLPSSGKFYQSGELADTVENGEIHIHPMTTIDEILMKSPDLLMNGRSYEEVFLRCIPEIKQPLELLAKDSDYILMCLRKVSFGPTVKISWNHGCINSKDHEYSIDIDDLLVKTKSFEGDDFAPKVIIKETGQEVSLRLMKLRDVITVYQLDRELIDLSPEEVAEHIASNIIKILSMMIISVDLITDKDMINDWLTQLPRLSIDQISQKIDDISHWGPNLKHGVKCMDCGEVFQATIPLNPLSFFT